jgi:polysaccharide biosynthesis/export protein
MNRLIIPLFVVLTSALFAGNVPSGFADRRYHLQPSDVLQLSYRYSPEYDETLTIQPDGFVSVKLIGDIRFEGLNLDEARAALLKALSTRLNNPEITLTLQEFVHPSFVVAGQVGTPGKYELHGHMSLVEAVAVAGGFKDSAKHSQVILFRKINPDVAKTKIVDLKRMTSANHPHLDEDLDIEPGDLIVVPKNQVSKIAEYIHWANIGAFVPL